MQMSGATPMMEHPERTVSVPPLVNARVLLRFCKAVQAFADDLGSGDDAAAALRGLRARLDNLRSLASLCRLAIVGHADSAARVADEMHCLSVDFPAGPLEDAGEEHDVNEDERDARVLLAAAVDLFAGASFVSKDKPARRDRFVVGIVRAIEDAIAFPVTFSAEAATYLGEGDGTLSKLHAKIVMANATQRLLERDRTCAPLVPADIRRRLLCLARRWMHENPVDAFFAAISGPKVHRIVHWEDPARPQPDDARAGDRVTLLVRGDEPADGGAPCGGADLNDMGVMFSPYAPTPVVRVVDDGLQVLVPGAARTGPVAVVKRMPDFTRMEALLATYAHDFPVEWPLSIFSKRIETWAFPTAFGPPVIEILRASQPSPNPSAGPQPPPNQPARPQPSPNVPANPQRPPASNPAMGTDVPR